MGFDTPAGTRGARMPGSSGVFARWSQRQVGRQHRRKGYRFQGMDLLFLTTTGRKSGQLHETPVAWFADGDDAWLIVASAGGAARNPGWYRNLATHPDQVSIELPGRKLRVRAQQLDGDPREEAWQRIIAAQPRFAKYQTKTDRTLPVIRLVPADAGQTPPDASQAPPDASQAPADDSQARTEASQTPPDASQAPPDTGLARPDAGGS
jgi:deazaflavin-dependent oxidoreductase (nitroreductase family)